MNENNKNKKVGIRFYAEEMSEKLWSELCTKCGRNPDDYHTLKISFSLDDVDDSDDDILFFD